MVFFCLFAEIKRFYKNVSITKADGNMNLCVIFLAFFYLCQNAFSCWHIWRQEGHPACKKAGCWFVGGYNGYNLTGALHVLQLQLSLSPPSSLAPMLSMETFWYWLTGVVIEMVVKQMSYKAYLIYDVMASWHWGWLTHDCGNTPWVKNRTPILANNFAKYWLI